MRGLSASVAAVGYRDDRNRDARARLRVDEGPHSSSNAVTSSLMSARSTREACNMPLTEATKVLSHEMRDHS